MMKKRNNNASMVNKSTKAREKVSNVKEKIKAKTKELKGKTKELKKKSKLKRFILNSILIVTIIVILGVSAFFAYVVAKAPKFDPNNLKFTQMSEIYDSEGTLLAKLGNENRTEISYDQLPEVLIDAIVATEDSRFFEHNGFDLPRFLKASFGQALGRNSGGASTLTMQIVKNNYTSRDSSGFSGILRKFTDIYLSIFKVEKKYTKKEILEFYVNDSYLGNGAYGVEQASQNYFGKSVGNLNLAEASFIAGLFQAPGSYDPYNYPEKAEKRRNTVLYLMKRHGYITEEERQIALSKPIAELIKTEKTNNDFSIYQGYIDTVVEELENKFEISPYTTPVKIYTAMNKSKQDYINKVMNGEAWTWSNDKVQAGIVMTNSQTGEVIAVGAGRNKNTQRSFNYATQINKQIGSTAKPIFVYGPAVEYLGWGTTNYIDDAPINYSNSSKSLGNSDGRYYGILPLYRALGLSRNTTALRTFQAVSNEAGNEKIVEFAKRLGMSPEVENGRIHEAHSIGAYTAPKNAESKNSPMTMAGAYGAFSNGGYYIEPHTITKLIYKETDEIIDNTKEKVKVMSPSTAFIINYSLRWSAQSGVAKDAASVSGVEIAAKTGTTNFDDKQISKYKLRRSVNDLWVCGYSTKNVVTFWYGYDRLYPDTYSTTADWGTRDRFYRNLAENLFDKDGSTFSKPNTIAEVYVVENSIPLRRANVGGVLGYFDKDHIPELVDTTTYEKLPAVSNVKSSVSGNTVKLSWNGVTAEQMLELNADESFGNLGYDIYVRDETSSAEVFVGTTTATTYTHTTNYTNPTYIIYTAYSEYKANRSDGVEHRVSLVTNFDVKVSSEEIMQGDKWNDSLENLPIIVLYNTIDVTDQSKIEKISGDVDTTTPGTYEIKYKITYAGTSKTISRKVIVKASTTTTSTTTTSKITTPTTPSNNNNE